MPEGLHPLSLKVCAADKVALDNTVNGAYLGTFATACTKRVIYLCEVVIYLDSSARTGLFAFGAADTAV